jgi:hypothetical protein
LNGFAHRLSLEWRAHGCWIAPYPCLSVHRPGKLHDRPVLERAANATAARENVCMKEVELGGEKSFIGAWYIPDLKVCDELIDFFKHSEGKMPGEIGHDREVNKDIKDSLDLIVTPDQFSTPVIRKYIINLYEVVKQYTDRYTYARLVNPWGIIENINLQYY